MPLSSFQSRPSDYTLGNSVVKRSAVLNGIFRGLYAYALR